MSAAPLTNLDRCCVHTMTTKPWSLDECVTHYQKAGIPGITVWRNVLEGRELQESGRVIADAGLRPVSLCRGGFFPATTGADRQAAIDDNKRAIDEAAAIGAPLVVLVCGAVPGQPLAESRAQIRDGIAACLDHAKGAGVKLGIEPLHPMYADDRSAVNTMGQANDLCDELASPLVGIAVDVYHLWWDPHLETEIKRAGEGGYILSFHVCDWRTPTLDLLNDRGLMGEGCLNLPQIRGWVEEAGFDGFVEVEVFSTRWWEADQHEYLAAITEAYLSHT